MLYTQLLALLLNATDAADRIYPLSAEEAPVRPYLVYLRASANSENVLHGSSGLINTRLQIDVYADTYVEAQALAGQVDTLMQGWSVQNISLPAQDLYEAETLLYRVLLEYSVWHT